MCWGLSMESSKEPIKEAVKKFTQDYVSDVVKELTKNIIKKCNKKKKEHLEDELKNLTYEEIEDYFEANPEYQKAFADSIKSINKKASTTKLQQSFKSNFTNYLPHSILTTSGVFIVLIIVATIGFGISLVYEPPSIPSVSIIDSTPPPAPTPDDDINGWSNVNNPTFRWSQIEDISGIAHYSYRIDSGSVENTPSTSVTLPEQSDGNHIFHVRAVDNAGNIGEYGSHEFSIDTIAPSAPTPDDGITGWSNVNNPTFRWFQVDDINGIAYYGCKIDSGSVENTESIFITLSEQSDGNHMFYARAVDNAGNIGEYGSHEFSIDTIAPSAPNPDDGITGWSNVNTPSFKWSPPDDMSSIAYYDYRIDSGSVENTESTFITLSEQSDGNHMFYARAVDNAGNIGEYGSHEFSIDTIEPSIQLPELLGDDWFTPVHIMAVVDSVTSTYDTPSFDWLPSDDISGIASYYYKVDTGSEYRTTGTSVTLPLQPAGYHTFYVRAKDNAGNFGKYGSINFAQLLRRPDLMPVDNDVYGYAHSVN